MKVDNPRFICSNPEGTVWCTECPFTDQDGFCEPHSPLYGLCNSWGRDHSPCCPTLENYVDACVLADSVTTGELVSVRTLAMPANQTSDITLNQALISTEVR